MGKKTVSYRGDLKSCNYRCSYCPFSKHKASAAELERDRLDFSRFCDSIAKRAGELSIGAVFIAPYGEASIHRWYWEGLGRLSGIPGIDRVGLQTNLSFSVEESLKIFDLYGGGRRGHGESRREKLCIWATFHPEMTGMDAFADKCRKLTQGGVRLCAGAVGVPRNIPLLLSLREALPPDIYLWINKMDGLGRKYTAEEKEAFSAIDPFFHEELRCPAADALMCADRCFVEADGRVRTCNIGKTKEINWYQDCGEELFLPVCGTRRCTCYLAYGGRADFGKRRFFGDYPIFRVLEGMISEEGDPMDGVSKGRIPSDGGLEDGVSEDRVPESGVSEDGFSEDWMLVDGGLADGIPKDRLPEHKAFADWKAVFLDLDGTLIPEGTREGLSDRVHSKLAALSKTCPIFLATSMPKEEAERRLKGDMELFDGAVFASGAYVQLWGKSGGEGDAGSGVKEAVHPLSGQPLPKLRELAERVKASVRVYRRKHMVYKITLFKRRGCGWKEEERQSVAELLERWDCRIFLENNCLEIVGKDLDKGTGIQEICGWLGILPEETAAMGNDEEDIAMERVCGAFFKEGSAVCRKRDSKWTESFPVPERS